MQPDPVDKYYNPYAEKLKKLRSDAGQVCEVCAEPFKVLPPEGTIRKYCSKTCRKQRHNRK